MAIEAAIKPCWCAPGQACCLAAGKAWGDSNKRAAVTAPWGVFAGPAYFAGLAGSAADCFALRAWGIRRCGASVAAEALLDAAERAASVAAEAAPVAEAGGAGLLASVAADAWLAADAGGGLLASVAAEACTCAPDCANAAPASTVAARARIAFVIIVPFYQVKVR